MLTTTLLLETFEPSAERGRSLDRRMRERLADSLEYVFAEAGAALGITPDAADELPARIRSGPQSPHAFGAYYDLVLALEADDLEHARDQTRQLLVLADRSGTQIAAVDDRPSSEAERYRRLFLSEIVADTPDAKLMADCRERLAQAFALLDSGFPEMAAEIRALLRDIVVAAGPTDPKALTFDGASSYMLWGAILLNARGQQTVLDTAQALAHESGHNLLFGLCASGPLIENPDDELFSSPLRTDPRPMDGVVHATYVVARMHQTLSRLLESGALDDAQVEAAKADLVVHRRNFHAGDEVIHEGARLTEVGRAAMDAARTYMAAAA
jgi:HEXXH motif-containing protein